MKRPVGASAIQVIFNYLKPDLARQKACEQLFQEFPDLFKPELGCLKDFQLDVKFKADAQSIFCKPRVVSFAIQEDLCQAYDAGIPRGVWLSTQLNVSEPLSLPFGRQLYPITQLNCVYVVTIQLL